MSHAFFVLFWNCNDPHSRDRKTFVVDYNTLQSSPFTTDRDPQVTAYIPFEVKDLVGQRAFAKLNVLDVTILRDPFTPIRKVPCGTPHLGHRQRHPHQQLLPSHYLKLVIGLARFPLVILSHGGSLL